MLDDIMISQAADGGSVGAHVDAYDVFLVQAAGNGAGNWRSRFDPALDERFEMALLAELAAGGRTAGRPGERALPAAGIAHHGVATTNARPGRSA
jgi:50S ribosomal protein L16 3-hydroxylase